MKFVELGRASGFGDLSRLVLNVSVFSVPFFAPGGGYLVECPTIRVRFGFVCLDVCHGFSGFLPNGICAGFKRRYQLHF